jgi:glycerol uptake facilitator-like aquaporin
MIISGCYVIALYIGFSSKPMMVISSQNPAISLGMITAVVFKPGRGIQNSGMTWAWIYLVFPWIGSVLAVVVYEFLFKKA